jgi:hypothetical protein
MAVSLILIKLLTTIILVLGLSWIAERIDTRLAGVISGMPLGALLILLFTGHELGPAFAAETALYGIPAMAATLVFAGAYYLGSRGQSRLSPIYGTLTGIPFYLVAAWSLSLVTFTLLSGLTLAAVCIGLAVRLFAHIPEEKVARRVRLTFGHILFRAGMAAVTVAIITGFAKSIGPQWSGLLIGFPVTFLPFLLIIHITYSAGHAHTIIRNFPVGLGGVISYLVLVNISAVTIGVNLSILLGLFGSLVYLALISYIFQRRIRKHA